MSNKNELGQTLATSLGQIMSAGVDETQGWLNLWGWFVQCEIAGKPTSMSSGRAKGAAIDCAYAKGNLADAIKAKLDNIADLAQQAHDLVAAANEAWVATGTMDPIFTFRRHDAFEGVTFPIMPPHQPIRHPMSAVSEEQLRKLETLGIVTIEADLSGIFRLECFDRDDALARGKACGKHLIDHMDHEKLRRFRNDLVSSLNGFTHDLTLESLLKAHGIANTFRSAREAKAFTEGALSAIKETE